MTYSIKVHDDFKKDLAKLSQAIQDQLYKNLKKYNKIPIFQKIDSVANYHHAIKSNYSKQVLGLCIKLLIMN